MNDFLLILNQPKQIKDLKIHQIQVKDINAFAPFAEKIRVKLNKDYSEETLKNVFLDCKFEAVTICSLVSNVFELGVLDNDNESEIFEIFKNVVLINEPYFNQEIKEAENEEISDSAWFDSFQMLISAGHKQSDILEYSFGAFMGYIKAVQKINRNKILGFAGATRVSYHADTKGFSKFSDSLK